MDRNNIIVSLPYPDFGFSYSTKNDKGTDYFGGNWNLDDYIEVDYDTKEHLDKMRIKYGKGNRWQWESSNFPHLITEDSLQFLNLKDVAWWGKHHYPKFCGKKCRCCGGTRYATADVKYPGVVVKDAPNPYGNPYTLIDGAHRMVKNLNLGMDGNWFYVLYWDEVREYLKWREKDSN